MIEIIVIALLSGLTTFIGVWLALRCTKRKKGIALGIGFSVGIMLAISFLELLTECLASMGVLEVVAAFAAGFIVVMAFDVFFPHQHFIKEKGRHGMLLKVGYMVALGMIIHDFPEGFAMASTYSVSAASGILVAIGIAVHNIPEEFALGVPLAIEKNHSLLWKMALVSALAEPLGAAVGVAFVALVPGVAPMLMAFAAGAMVFVCIDELLPLATKYYSVTHTSAGVFLGILSYMVLGAFV